MDRFGCLLGFLLLFTPQKEKRQVVPWHPSVHTHVQGRERPELESFPPDFHKYTSLENGRLPSRLLDELALEVAAAKSTLPPQRLRELSRAPRQAGTLAEKLLSIAGRKVFILVDQSGSMKVTELSPLKETPGNDPLVPWTRWKNAAIATEALVQTVLKLGADSLSLVLWSALNPDDCDELAVRDFLITEPHSVPTIFSDHKPQGSSPLGLALGTIYEKHLLPLLEQDQAFTVIILTDGPADDPIRLRRLLEHIQMVDIRSLARFVFVQVGDDNKGARFIHSLVTHRDLAGLLVTFRLSDLLGATPSLVHAAQGPLALLWKAAHSK